MASSSRNAAHSLLALSAKKWLPDPRFARSIVVRGNEAPSSSSSASSSASTWTTSSCRRSKSSIPFLSAAIGTGAHDDVRDRASRSASEFDAHHGLLSSQKETLFSSSSSSWRGRQMAITRQNPVRPHPKLPRKSVNPTPDRAPSFFPPYARTGRPGPPSLPPDHVLIHDEPSVARMTTAARLARRLLDYVCHPSVAKAGRTTEEIDDLLHRAALERGAYPSPLNYSGFPKSVCSSINEVVCHGIPDSRPLAEGDVVSFDVSCYVGGVHGDNCATVVVGDVEDGFDFGEFSWDHNDDDDDDTKKNGEAMTAEQSAPHRSTIAGEKDWPSYAIPPKTAFSSPEEEERFVTARRLVRAALESRDEGVAACRPGGCLSDIGGAIHAVAEAYGYDTVRHYRGHGISSDFHCAPFVKHFRNSETMELLPGMIFTIEPMITEGSAECGEWSDDWTVVTRDGGRAAQFEHTVLITETGVKILTLP